MCKCGGGTVKKNGGVAAPAMAAAGDTGLVWLEYVGDEPATEYGPVTGARYPFQAANPRYVDARDAEKMKQNSPERFLSGTVVPERVYA